MKSNHNPEVCSTLGTRLEPGTYSAYCARADVYYDRVYKRWICLLQFDVTDGFNVIARIPRWFNLGKRDKPHAGRRSEYFKAWVRANDGKPPKRANRLSPVVFLKRVAKVQIADVGTEIPYSTAREILSWETGIGASTINQSTINQGISQVGQKERVTESACQSRRPVTQESGEPLKIVESGFDPSRGRESTQSQLNRREAGNGLPQRHYSAIGVLPKVNIAERRELLKAQAAKLAMQVHSKCTADVGLA
jgi:hypothetical protein